MSELYALTIKKEASLKKLGYKYICKWDHQYQKEMSDNLELSKFPKALNVMPRLDPRDSFFGGRVNTATLHYKIKEGEMI